MPAHNASRRPMYAFRTTFLPPQLGTSVRVLRLCAVFAAQASTRFPDRHLRTIAPFPPGRVAEAIARLVEQKHCLRLGQPVLIDHGAIGPAAAAHTPADGYTVALGINPSRRTRTPRAKPKARQAPPVPSSGVNSCTAAIAASRRCRRSDCPARRQVFWDVDHQQRLVRAQFEVVAFSRELGNVQRLGALRFNTDVEPIQSATKPDALIIGAQRDAV